MQGRRETPSGRSHAGRSPAQRSLALTGSGLAEALAGVAGSLRAGRRGAAPAGGDAGPAEMLEDGSPAGSHAARRMRARAPAALAALTRHGARRLLRQPLGALAERVGSLDPAGLPRAADILARAEHAYAAERARGRSGHWSYDLNRQLALAEAVVALRHLVRTRR